MCCPEECECNCKCCRGQVEKYVNFDEVGASASSEPVQTMVRLSTKHMLTLLRVVQSLDNFWSNQYYKVDLHSDFEMISAAFNSEEIMNIAPQIMESITAGYRRAVAELTQSEASTALRPKSITWPNGVSLRCECIDCEQLPWNELQELEAHQWLHRLDEKTHCNICYRRFFIQHTMLSYLSRRNIRNETGELQENASYKQLLTEQKLSEQPSGPAVQVEQLHLRLSKKSLMDYVDETCTISAPPVRKRSTQIKCVQCNYLYKYSFSYQLHMKKFHLKPLDSRLWNCASCCRIFRTRRFYLQHVRRVRSACRIRLRRFNCTRCKKSFQLQGTLIRHVAKKHPKLIKCRVCNILTPWTYCREHFKEVLQKQAAARQDSALKRKANKTQNSTKVTCKYCSKVLYNAGTLTSHIKMVHLKKLDYICHYCGKGFAYQNFMLRHISAVHEMECTAYCELCDVTLTDRSNYIRHCKSLAHLKNLKLRGQLPPDAELKDKKWYCELCDRQLSTAACYYLHLKSKMHKRETSTPVKRIKGPRPKRRFYCERCDLELANPQSYHKHKKSIKHQTQNGGSLADHFKLWYCKFCDCQLSTSTTYLAHLKTQRHLMLSKRDIGYQDLDEIP